MPYNKQRLVYWGLLVVGVWFYWHPLQSIVENWSSNPDYSHGFLVPLICGAILYIRRDARPQADSAVSYAGLALLFFAGLMRYAAGRLYFPELDAWSLPVWVAGWVWLCFGWKSLRWAAPAIGFLFFAMPLPATVEIMLSTPLQKIAAGCSAWTLRLAAQPAIANGTVIFLDSHQFEVERACSGLRMFFGILALAVATITIARPGLWKSLLLLACVVPVSIVANVVRIDVTALLARYWSGEISEKFSHDFAAVAMVPLAAAMFGGVLWLLNSATRRISENKAQGAAWGIRWGVATAVALVAILFTQRFFENRALSTLKQTAQRFEEEGDYARASAQYSRYLSFVPDDVDTAIHLAEIAHKAAHDQGEWLRTAQLYLRAWKLDPHQTELAVTAAQIAINIHDYQMALDIYEKLRKSPIAGSTLSLPDIEKLYADTLVKYLRWGQGRAEVTWSDAATVLQNVIDSGDYEVWHAVELSHAITNSAAAADPNDNEKTRQHRACDVFDKLVTDKPDNPLAWLAKFEFENGHNACSADDPRVSLDKALQLVDRQTGSDAASVYYVAAQASLQSQDTQAAEEYLKQAIAARPDFYLSHLALAQVYLSRDAADSDQLAIAALESGLAQVQGTELSLLVPLASLLARTAQYEKAEALLAPLEQVASKVSEEERGAIAGSIALVRGRIAAEQNAPRRALDELLPALQSPNFQQTQSRFPRVYSEIWTLYGDVCTRLDMLDIAASAYQRAIQLNPNFGVLRFQLANLATNSGDLSLAEQQLRVIVDRRDKYLHNAYVALANVKLEQQKRLPPQRQNWADVTTALKTASQNGAPPEVIEVMTAEMLAAQGRGDEAIRQLEQALERDNESAVLWQGYAKLQQELGNNDAALRGVEKFRQYTDEPLSGVILQSRLLAASGKSADAISLLQNELNVDHSPADQSRLYVELAHTHLRNSDMPAAVRVLETAHEKLPQNGEVVDDAARLAWLRQDWDALAKYVEALKEIEGPNGTEWRAYQAQALLAKLETADASTFGQVIELVQFISQKRPNWPKSHFLLGELALVQGELDAALTSYQRAWQFGSRNILLADRILDIYTRTNRLSEAKQFVSQTSDILAASSQLFDRAVPYFAKGNDREQALSLAKSWAAARPGDAEAQMRLGRVLMILAEDQKSAGRAEYLADAENAFRAAVEMAPSDLRTWVACVLFYDQVRGSRESAVAILQELAKGVSFPPRQKAFVLAQLYNRLQLADQARKYYWDAVALCTQTRDPESLEILTHAAAFYASQSPRLAESLARQVLAVQPDNYAARLTLANLLLASGDAAAREEAGQVLKHSLSEPVEKNLLPVIRTQIRYLSEAGTPEDIAQAIQLAESILKKSPDDMRKLADLYERADRIAAAFNILDELAGRVSPRPQDLTEYLRFWQQHFVSHPEEDGQIPFRGGANDVYATLGQSPALLGELTRWKIRERKVGKPQSALTSTDREALVAEVASARAVASVKTPQEQQQVLTGILSAAIAEGEPQLATRLCSGCFATLPQTGQCRSLIEALIMNRGAVDGPQPAVDAFLAAVPDEDVELTQLLGDLRFLQGRYAEAVQQYRKVLDHVPTSTMAQNNLALAIAEDSAPIGDARNMLQAALKRLPDNPRLVDSLATIELIAGNADLAIDQLQPLASGEAADASVWLHLAEAHRRTGDMDNARIAFQHALGLGIEQQLLSMRDQQWLQELSACFECSSLFKRST